MFHKDDSTPSKHKTRKVKITMVNKRIIDFKPQWKEHLIVHTSILLEYPRYHTIAGYLCSSGLNESARHWINRQSTMDLIASTINEELVPDHWFSKLKPWQRAFLVEFILESAKGNVSSMVQFAGRNGIPVRNAYYLASSNQVKWLRGQIGRLRREWKRMVYYLYGKKTIATIP